MAESELEHVEPAQDFLGFECASCHRTFPIVGPLDPVQMPLDKPLTVGSRGPLHAECPHCRRSALYPIDQLRRVRTE